MHNPLSFWHWVRLWAGSAVSFITLGWIYHLGFDTSLTAALFPISLGLIGVLLSWPVIFRAVFGDLLYRDPDGIYDEIVSKEE